MCWASSKISMLRTKKTGSERESVEVIILRGIRDLERVSWKADSHDNLLPQLDKTNPGLTHVSDALGYLIEAEFGVRQNGGPRAAFIG